MNKKKNMILNKKSLTNNNKLTNRNIPLKKNRKNVEESVDRNENKNKKTPMKKKSVPTVGGKKKTPKKKIIQKKDRENVVELEESIKLRKKVSVNENIKQGEKLDNSYENIQLCPFDCLIFFGDLNYRLELPRLEVELMKASLGSMDKDHKDNAIEGILAYDQLNRERISGRAFQGYSEGKISFMPTFKYDKGSDEFDTSSKARPPAWTDRVLFNTAPVENSKQKLSTKILKTEEENAEKNGEIFEKNMENSIGKDDVESSRLELLRLKNYDSVDSMHSDHRPVAAQFSLNFDEI
jgi:hypothetical protein